MTPSIFCNFLEEGFSVNVFGFGIHSCFWFHQVLWHDLRRGSLLPCLVDFYFSKFGCLGHVGALIFRARLIFVSQTLLVVYGVWMACSHMWFLPVCIVYCFCYCGGSIFPIRRAESCGGTGLVQGRWRRFNAFFPDLSHVYWWGR